MRRGGFSQSWRGGRPARGGGGVWGAASRTQVKEERKLCAIRAFPDDDANIPGKFLKDKCFRPEDITVRVADRPSARAPRVPCCAHPSLPLFLLIQVSHCTGQVHARLACAVRTHPSLPPLFLLIQVSHCGCMSCFAIGRDSVDLRMGDIKKALLFLSSGCNSGASPQSLMVIDSRGFAYANQDDGALITFSSRGPAFIYFCDTSDPGFDASHGDETPWTPYHQHGGPQASTHATACASFPSNRPRGGVHMPLQTHPFNLHTPLHTCTRLSTNNTIAS